MKNRETFAATNAVAITPSDSADVTTVPSRGIYVGVAGNLRVTLADMADGAYVTLSNVPVGIHPLQVKRVWSTGTTATTMHALF